MPDGRSDPGFVVTEPVRNEDQTAVKEADASERPKLELPTITYFAIPAYFAMLLASVIGRTIMSGDHLAGFSSMSLFDIAVATALGAVIGIPMLITFVRAFRHFRHVTWPWQVIPEFTWLLSMFRLPESIRREHHWFVPVYVGSLYGFCIVIPILTVTNALLLSTR